MSNHRLPRLAYNWITALGAVLAVISGLTLGVILVVIFTLEPDTNPYFGMFIYTVLPAVLVLGLLLIPVGMLRQWRRWKTTGEMPVATWPRIDFNKSEHRNAAIIFIVGTTLFVIISSVSTYEAYHYSESVEFCGTTCHQVMHPEYTTYQNSPHARVACAACHIGPGADWFVRSKLSGTYQIYATLAESYPRPIPTPIENLRPAQETCEQCHWPERIFGAQQVQFQHFKYDEENTSWPINMLIKTGGGDPRTGQTAGIHWHMNIGVKVEYIHRDERRQDIPWVRVTDRQTGRVTVYQDESAPLSEEEIAAAEVRVMDCMDCHNRPSHIYKSPDAAVDHRILIGEIDQGIPEVKRIAVEAMTKDYPTTDDALREIAGTITDFYRKEHPDFFRQNTPKIDRAVLATQNAFSQNIFPAMKARWSDYPDNIGHFINKGCMRCHEGNHVSDDGVQLTHDCNTCHTILSQGSGERAEVAATQEGLEFQHPEDIGEMWREVGCYECHSGVQP
jgi:hypothetical protein